MKRLHQATFSLLFFLSLSSAPGSIGLLDPGFEVYNIPNWTGTRETGQMPAPSYPVHSGSASLLVLDANSIWQVVSPVTPGDQLRMSAWHYNPSNTDKYEYHQLQNGAHGMLEMTFLGSSGESLATFKSNQILPPADSLWHQTTLDGLAPAGAASVKVMLSVYQNALDQGSGGLFYDDVELVAAPEPVTTALIIFGVLAGGVGMLRRQRRRG